MSWRSCGSKKAKVPSGAARSAEVRDHVDIAARNPEVGCARLDEPCWGAEVLHLTGVGRRGDQRRISAVRIWAVDVGQQGGAVAHGHPHVVLGANL